MKKTNSLKISRLIALLSSVYTAIDAKSQTQVDLRTQSKSVDFSQAASTLPVQTGTSLPSTCMIGALYFMTSAPPGANLYACVTANTWTLETGGAASSGTTAPSGQCTGGSVYNDTANGNIWLCENSGWQKALTTSDSGTFVITGQAGSAPATPATGSASLFFSSSARVAQSLDDTGNSATMVRPTDCAGTGQLLQKINADGTATCASNIVRAIGYSFDGGGSALTSGLTKYLTVPFACTISGWNIAVDAGTATVRTWKAAAGTAIPVAQDSISTSGVSISSGTAIHSTAVGDFTATAVNANDIFGFNLSAVSGATYVNFILECRQ